MKTLIRTSIKRRHRDLLVALALCCAALLPAALAGSPTTVVGEDRGKNNSAAEGIESLGINTIGQNNTAHGWYALSADTQGSDNAANGFGALFGNTTGDLNTATGSQALSSNTVVTRTRPAGPVLSRAIPPVSVTLLRARLRCLVTRPARQTPPVAPVRSRAIRSPALIPPPVRAR